jgi:hypothetical protein
MLTLRPAGLRILKPRLARHGAVRGTLKVHR